MKYIKNFILTFENNKLEQQYQIEKKDSIQQPIFVFIIVISFISNLVVLGFHFFEHYIQTWYLNIAFSILSILLFIIVIIMKKINYLQDALTIVNITLGFLQLNVDPESTNQLEFFSYGNTFMQLQAVLYIVSNFSHAFIQVFCHLILRLSFTIIISERTDYLLIFIGLISGFIILVTIYYNEKNSRKYFIQNLKENYWEKNTSFIVEQPYIRCNFLKEQLLFNLIKSHKIEGFPGFDNYYCEGCNIRQLLRIYFLEKNVTIEDLLIQQRIKLPQKFLISYKQRNYLLKICSVDIQQAQYLIILDKIKTVSQQQEEEKQVQQNNFIKFLRLNEKHSYQYFFNWGAQSLLFLNKKIIKKINLQQQMTKILKIFRIHIFRKISIEIITKDQNTSIFTFCYQIKIFMMQLFQILSTIQRINNNLKFQIILKRKGCDILIQINNIDQQTFQQQFESNFFLQTLSSLLLHEIEMQQKIQLLFRNYPIQSFVFNT